MMTTTTLSTNNCPAKFIKTRNHTSKTVSNKDSIHCARKCGELCNVIHYFDKCRRYKSLQKHLAMSGEIYCKPTNYNYDISESKVRELICSGLYLL